jgi:hypothetical protein
MKEVESSWKRRLRQAVMKTRIERKYPVDLEGGRLFGGFLCISLPAFALIPVSLVRPSIFLIALERYWWQVFAPVRHRLYSPLDSISSSSRLFYSIVHLSVSSVVWVICGHIDVR